MTFDEKLKIMETIIKNSNEYSKNCSIILEK